MVSGFLSFLADLREESSFFPPIAFGYVYSVGHNQSHCFFGIDILLINFTGFSQIELLQLAAISLITGAGVYTLAKYNESSSKIRNSSTPLFGYFLDSIVIFDFLFTISSIWFLAIHICWGKIILNGLLFLQLALFLTTIWSILLSIFTDVEGWKGLSR